MIFSETELKGAFILDINRLQDERGFFARSFCQNEFQEHGLAPVIAQGNISYNRLKGTLRGMHYQTDPSPGSKVVRCVHGAIYDVIIDLRTGSPTCKSWFGIELSARNYRMLYVPAYFAHGFITLENDTEVNYLESQFYDPKAERGVRYNDPVFGIVWPGRSSDLEKRTHWRITLNTRESD